MIIAMKVEHTYLSFNQLIRYYEMSLAELRPIKREIKKRLKERECFTSHEEKRWLRHLEELDWQHRKG